MIQRKTLSSWLSTQYLFIVREEENFAERMTLRLTPAKVALGIVGVFLFAMLLSYFTITTLLSRWADPRHQALQTKRSIRNMNYQIDSLTQLTASHELYLERIRGIMEGRADVLGGAQDGANASVAVDVDTLNLDKTSPIDSLFRKEFEDSDYDGLVRKNTARDALQQIFFFSPVKGIVSDVFSVQKRHYGVDVVAKKDEPIKAVADGSVIMSSWTQDAGYVIAVQHKNQVISFYKHNSMLLKEVGDMVKAGDVIAIIGNSGEYTDGPHLHFELWYEGNPVNPEDFVHF